MEIHDVFGIEKFGQAGLAAVEAGIDGLSSFLKMVFKPGLEELGFLMKDQVRLWRLNNIIRVLDKAKGRLDFDGKELNLIANARVGLSIMEECSSVDDDLLQDLWAGLFVSSCTSDGRDDSNMNFVDLIRRMSSVEAKVLEYSCKKCEKILFPNKLITAKSIVIPFDELVSITGVNDVYRLDSELDHMRSIELLVTGSVFASGGGFEATDLQLDANITPSALALNLYYKTHTTEISPIKFWGKSLSPYDENKD